MKTLDDLTLAEAKKALINAAQLLWDRWDDCPECDLREHCAAYRDNPEDIYGNICNKCQKQILQMLVNHATAGRGIAAAKMES